MEAYVNDMIVKIKTFEDHLEDLWEMFGIIGQFGLNLNPEKCFFFTKRGKFLGYMVSSKEIEPNFEKVQEIIDMPPHSYAKDI